MSSFTWLDNSSIWIHNSNHKFIIKRNWDIMLSTIKQNSFFKVKLVKNLSQVSKNLYLMKLWISSFIRRDLYFGFWCIKYMTPANVWFILKQAGTLRRRQHDKIFNTFSNSQWDLSTQKTCISWNYNCRSWKHILPALPWQPSYESLPIKYLSSTHKRLQVPGRRVTVAFARIPW